MSRRSTAAAAALPASTGLHVVGLDVAKDTLAACLATLTDARTLRIVHQPATDFVNTPTGIALLIKWLRRYTPAAAPLRVVCEATGTYHEELAYTLHAEGIELSVCQPLQAKQFARSTSTKSKTDALDARLLAQFGLERALPLWQPFHPLQRTLRAVLREQATVRTLRAQVLVRLHAYGHSHQPNEQIIKRLKEQQAFCETQIADITTQLIDLVAQDEPLRQVVQRLQTIPGLGFQTVLTILAETNGFTTTTNARQLLSYAGLDVVQGQSGTSVRLRARISKRGNAHLRTAIYLPAVSALRHNPQQAAFFERLRLRQPTGKGPVVAVMRKLLALAYSLYQSKQSYDPTRSQAAHRTKKIAATDNAAAATQDGETEVAPPILTPKVRKKTPKFATLTQ